MSCPALGVALAAYDDAGRPVRDRVGELVVTAPMPTMPLYLWNDPSGERYRETYVDTFPGMSRHGDWATVTGRGTVVVHGRLDATLNWGGVRLGSAEIYVVAESVAGIREALIVGLEEDGGG
jgi:acetoacetyl-CoA synthetase